MVARLVSFIHSSNFLIDWCEVLDRWGVGRAACHLLRDIDFHEVHALSLPPYLAEPPKNVPAEPSPEPTGSRLCTVMTRRSRGERTRTWKRCSKLANAEGARLTGVRLRWPVEAFMISTQRCMPASAAPVIEAPIMLTISVRGKSGGASPSASPAVLACGPERVRPVCQINTRASPSVRSDSHMALT